MKTLRVLTIAALVGCALPMGLAATKEAKAPAPKETKAPAAKETKPEPPAKEEPLVGILIDRTDGSKLNLKVENGSFLLRFLDANKQPVAADFVRGIIRFRKEKVSYQYPLLAGGDGKSLRGQGGGPINRPYIFPQMSILLFKEGSEKADASFMVFFRQPMEGDGKTLTVEEMSPEQRMKEPK